MCTAHHDPVCLLGTVEYAILSSENNKCTFRQMSTATVRKQTYLFHNELNTYVFLDVTISQLISKLAARVFESTF